ncbi:hypothetical protein EDC94DRAFT_621199 [Helicostylum pulchrum]|nr:hypothetical protein EDC94DRAFT_621199 [Helicostylum pulchrum]
MSKLSADIQGKIRQLFPPPHITTPCIEQRFEEIQNELRHTESKNGCYFKRYLEKLEAFKSTEKYKISKKLYTIILDLMLYDSYIFDPTDSNNLSEGDYVVKVWGLLLETLFRGSGVILHWGDTVPENIKAENKIIKMDLRIINSLGDKKSKSNIATAEITKNITPSKFYRDKLKTVLSSKADINEIISSLSKVNDSTVSIYVPFIIIAELEATVCALHLGGNGLYVINEVTTISLPTTLLEVKNGGILTAVNNLYILKKLVVESNDIIKNIAELETVKKRKTLKKSDIPNLQQQQQSI